MAETGGLINVGSSPLWNEFLAITFFYFLDQFLPLILKYEI